MNILNQALTLHKQGRLSQAENLYIQALGDDYDDPQLLYLLGTIYIQTKRPGLAAQLFLRSAVLRPDNYEVWNNLGVCYKQANKEVDARLCWERAMQVEGRKPQEYSDTLNNIATNYVNSGGPEEGLPLVEEALQLNPDNPHAHWNYALMQLELGNYGVGFDHYSAGFDTKNRIHRNYGKKVVDWDGSPGKTVVVWGEQGIGDEILFSSMIRDLISISKKVIIDCHPRLVKIFRASFPETEIYGTRKDDYIGWTDKYPELDAKIAMGDLGKFFRRKLEDFPDRKKGYLKVKKKSTEYYRKKLAKLGPRLKVGISWTGGYKKTRSDFRSIKLDKWLPILGLDADFISLQYTPDAYKTIADIEDKHDVRVHHWPSAVEHPDYHETAALVSQLDLVITINTAVHHLAGALGVPCWTMTPQSKAWRYYSPNGTGKRIPWYPSVTQYQQREIFNWNPILNQVAGDLVEKINAS